MALINRCLRPTKADLITSFATNPVTLSVRGYLSDLDALNFPKIGQLGREATMLCSFLAGLSALRWLTRLLERGRWQWFGYYCLLVALAVFLLHIGRGDF